MVVISDGGEWRQICTVVEAAVNVEVEAGCADPEAAVVG
jgi:hypothetical protein